MSSPRGLVYQGMVGEVRLADLLPHEATLGTWAVKPTPPIEIRPLLAVGEAPLPDLAPAGPEVSVAYGSLVHRLTPLEAPVDGVATGTLVLADGHHRRQGALADLGPAATAMVLVVGSGGAGLRAEAFQRVFRGIGRLPGALERPFSIEPLSRVMPRVGALVWVYASGEGVVLRPRADALQALPAPLRRIGAAVAQHLLYPLLGVDDSDATHYSTTAGARHALAGDDGALLLPRVAVADVVAAARTGVLLPPKGSRFRPKPLRGLLLRDQPEIVDPNRAMIRS